MCSRCDLLEKKHIGRFNYRYYFRCYRNNGSSTVIKVIASGNTEQARQIAQMRCGGILVSVDAIDDLFELDGITEVTDIDKPEKE